MLSGTGFDGGSCVWSWLILQKICHADDSRACQRITRRFRPGKNVIIMNQRLSFTVSLLGHLGFKSTAGQQAPSLALATLAGAKTNKSKSVKELAEPEAKSE